MGLALAYYVVRRHGASPPGSGIELRHREWSGTDGAPLISPSRLVSINSKSNTATVCASVGPQTTRSKAHDTIRYVGCA
jgi:hypothetical protein